MLPGLELVELSESSWCCGSAGIYNLTNTEESLRILDRKMENIRATGADLILTGNPGCMAQLRYGVKRHRLKADVLHPVTILLALILWGTIWGIVGMLLATPITAVMKILFERLEVTRPLAGALAGRF